MAVDFEIVELASGRTLHSDTLDSRSGGLDLDVGYYEPELSGELSQYRNKPAGKAIAKAIAKLAREIESHLTRATAGDRVADSARRSGASAPTSTEAVAKVPEREAVPAAPAAAPANVSTNYGFVPGTRVLFEDDFSDTPIGDFPHRLRFKTGAMEVVDWNGRQLLRAQGGRQDHFEIPLPETLPDRFTLEFDIHDANSPGGDVDRIGVYFQQPPERGFSLTRPGGAPRVGVSNSDGLGVFTYIHEPISSVESRGTALSEGLVRIQVQVDGEAVKVYADRERIANVPNIDLGRHDAITFLIQAQKDPTYIGNIRVAAGGQDLYSALRSEGRVTARDVLFETDSARIQSGSAAALAEIAAMLRQHPELRLRIEGHTDDTSSASSNLRLSQQRAEAVRDHLVSQEGIDGSRLEAVGLGEEQPVADNGTETGRAQNRRVELVSVVDR